MMNTYEERAKDYLIFMLDSLDAILEYTSDKSREEFKVSWIMQDAVLRNIGIVGRLPSNYWT